MSCQRRSGKRYIIPLPHYEYQHGTSAIILSENPDYSDVISPPITFFEKRITRTWLQCAVCVELLPETKHKACPLSLSHGASKCGERLVCVWVI